MIKSFYEQTSKYYFYAKSVTKTQLRSLFNFGRVFYFFLVGNYFKLHIYRRNHTPKYGYGYRFRSRNSISIKTFLFLLRGRIWMRELITTRTFQLFPSLKIVNDRRMISSSHPWHHYWKYIKNEWVINLMQHKVP